MFSITVAANTHSLHYILVNRLEKRRSYHVDFIDDVPFQFLKIIGPITINFSFKIAQRNHEMSN